jgi:hypothetical protein
MPIHINLLAEAQGAEDLRRRDPVKRLVYIAVVLVAAMFAWLSGIYAKVIIANRELSQVQFQVNSDNNAYQTAIANNAKIAAAKTKLAALQKLTNARLLQGNLLNALQKVSADNVQLTSIRVDQAYGSNNDKSGKPTSVTERIVVTLEAKDSSANPGDQVGKFKAVLAKESYFQDNLDKTNGIQLADESSPQEDQSGRSFVSFTLECHFPEIKR